MATYFNASQSVSVQANGTDQIYFSALAAPPVSPLDREVLYTLTSDHGLYYNGSKVATSGGSPTFSSATLTPQAVNPGGANTFWTSSASSPAGHLFHGSKDMENYDPTQVYVDPTGLALAAGGTGACNSPVATIADALTLWNANGTTFKISGDYSGEAFVLPAQTVVCGVCGPSFRTLLGNVTASGATWTVPPPFGVNQSYIDGCVVIGTTDFQASPMTIPQLGALDSVFIGAVTALDTDCDANVFMKNSIIAGGLTLTDCNGEFQQCTYSLNGGSGGPITLNHTAAVSMDVAFVDGWQGVGGAPSLEINHSSATNTLAVSIVGLTPFSAINVNAVAAGGLNLFIDDIFSINYAPGTQALTNVIYVKRAPFVGYSPAVPGDWSPAPVQAAEALDQLAARPSGTGDVVGPAGATDSALCVYDGVTGKLIKNSLTRLFDVTGLMLFGGSEGAQFPNADAPNTTGQDLRFWRRSFTLTATTGPFVVPNNILLLYERTGNVVTLTLGSGLNQVADAASAAIVTVTPIATWARPTTNARSSVLVTLDNSVYAVGTISVATTGIVTFRPTPDPTSTFTGPGLLLSGVWGGSAFSYTIE